tara:strand:- start:1658 stop:1864 length:207 start_codon:yes stop_codon:yes gene_type:complete
MDEIKRAFSMEERMQEASQLLIEQAECHHSFERAIWNAIKKEPEGPQPKRGRAPEGAWKQLFKPKRTP